MWNRRFKVGSCERMRVGGDRIGTIFEIGRIGSWVTLVAHDDRNLTK